MCFLFRLDLSLHAGAGILVFATKHGLKLPVVMDMVIRVALPYGGWVRLLGVAL